MTLVGPKTLTPTPQFSVSSFCTMRNLECIISEVPFTLTQGNAKCEEIISSEGKKKQSTIGNNISPLRLHFIFLKKSNYQ